MSIKYTQAALELLSLKSGRINLNKETLKVIRSIEEELIIICFVGKDSNQKSGLISSIVGNFEDSKEGVWIWGTPIQKEASSSKLLIVNCHNITDSNGKGSNSAYKTVLSLLFLSSSMFIINCDSGLDDKQLLTLDLFASLPSSLEMKNKNSREVIFSECSPKAIFYISNAQVDQKTVFPRDYLDACLRKKTETEIDLIRDYLLRYFPDRDCLFIPTDLKAKLSKEVSSKSTKGKKFNGQSFAFFINEWCSSANSNQIPHFDNIWDKMIQDDIDTFQKKGMNEYQSNIEAIKDVLEQDDLIKQLYEIKLKAMMSFNTIFKFNQDTFNNSEYLSWYNNTKRAIEQEIEKHEKEKIEENIQQSEDNCKSILRKEYSAIEKKIESNHYNSQTCDEFLKDYDKFLGSYSEKSKGPSKLRVLIDFISKTKPEFVKSFVENLDNENKVRLEEANKKLANSNKYKQEAEEKFRELNEETEDNSKKIEDLNSGIEKKKREIINLNEQIEKIENEILQIRQEGGGK